MTADLDRVVLIGVAGDSGCGKSTLLNALLNENRALVSDIPGTTRDTVEEYLNIDGVIYKLIDTAGIRANTEDSIEQMGIEKSREKIEAADIVIALFDINQSSHEQIGQWTQEINADKLILVANKIDQLNEEELFDLMKMYNAEGVFEQIVPISALKGRNINELLKVIKSHLEEGPQYFPD